MSWQMEVSKRGRNPGDVVDAEYELEFTIPDDPMFLRGCVIGVPTKCTAAKAVKEEPGVVWAWISAIRAVVEFDNGEILRYVHNGVIPKTQDQLIMPPPGEYRLMPPRGTQKLGSKHRVARGKRDKPRKRRTEPVILSTAGELRR
jgi:hypothetical protein